MSSTKWQQFWSGRIEAPYRFALHDYLARPRAYATISTAEMCLKLINSSWPDGFARITASYRCAAQGPRLAICSPPSSWQAGLSPQDIWRAARPGALSGAWLLSQIWFIVRRAGLLWSQQDFEWRWSVPLFKCLTVLEFSFILFDLCLLITFFNFIMNYVPIVTFWIFTYHKIWILSIMFCSIWSYWIIYFLACLEVSWRVVS